MEKVTVQRCSTYSRLSIMLITALLFAGCASLSARSTFSRGVKARDKGELRPAIAAFAEAYRQDPKSEYAEALKKAQAEVARTEVAKAQAAEASKDFSTAAKHWAAAVELAPDNGGLQARKGLAELEGSNPDPVQRQTATARLFKLAPKDKVVQDRLRTATHAAAKYHLSMARMHVDVRSWQPAFRAYEAARQLQPKNMVFDGALYRDVQVREYERQGDEKLGAGDMLGAYEAYDIAVKLRPSRRLTRKMKRAHKGAGPVIQQIKEAEGFARSEQWEDAAEVYSMVVGRPETPAEVRTAATAARAKSAKIRAERARAYAERNLLDKSVAELRLSLEHSDGAPEALRAIGEVVEALDEEHPEIAQDKLQPAQTSGANLAVVQAVPTVIAHFASRLFARAQARAESDPGEALVLMSRLGVFEASLPGYAKQKKKLVKTAFGQLLQGAERFADQGRFGAAIERLASALAIAKPPAALAKPLETAITGLKGADWVRARAAFSAAIKQNKRSRLAKSGLVVAERAHLAALRQEARDARNADDSVRASTAYRSILELAKDDFEAQSALLELQGELVSGALTSAKTAAAAKQLGAAFVYFNRIIVLDPEHGEATAALATIKAQLGNNSGPSAFVAPIVRGPKLATRCRGVERALRDRMALYLNRTRGLAVTFLEGAEAQKVDSKEIPVPPVQITSTVTACAATKTGGSMSVQVKLLSGPTAIFDQAFSAEFDPKSVPKDEIEAGLAPRQVVMDLLGKVAKNVSKKVKADAKRLAGWRVHLAQDRMKAGDAEGAALAYAGLILAKDTLSTEEQGALDALTRYLNNRFR
jgi:hypothetical protein